MKPASAELFTRNGKRLLCEISEVKDCISVPNQGMDSERIVITIRNPRTRNSVTWVSVEVVTNQEGEIERWVLEPLSWDLLQFPALSGWQVVLFND